MKTNSYFVTFHNSKHEVIFSNFYHFITENERYHFFKKEKSKIPYCIYFSVYEHVNTFCV